MNDDDSNFDNDTSMWRMVGIGIAAENKKLGSHQLTIMPHEKLNFADGEIADKVDTLSYNGKNSSGDAVGGTAFIGQTIEATWRIETNRRTAPDIRRGERIEIWQFAGNDKYYWRDIALDQHLRRLETVTFAINACPDESQDANNPDNQYFVEFSSHSKTITLSTSKKNGEFCTYDLQLDLANGRVVLTDDLGNHILLDSKNTNIQFTNARGTQIELNKNNINMVAIDDINAKAGKNVNIEAGQNINMKAGVKAVINGGGSILTLTAGGTTLKTPTFAGSS